MEWWIFLGWAGVLFFFGCWLKGRWCPSRFYCHKACYSALHVININVLGGDVRLVRRCRLRRRSRPWRLFFGVCVFFSTFSAFSCVFSAFGVFGLFGVFGACSAFGVFGIVGFGEWKFTFWLRPYPAHFLTACDDGIWVLCYAVCFLRPGYIIMRASGS